mmetsp:Transcript_4477/g.6048  ORF Transcript_4477/g.6048 Transcript_4477/m.6048 type:complete len:498 (+) Transcript_4477:104-1597(+)|eukprot:CAMPEP_0196579906 /NCGR_PEP_ID=MMETSP1081-20130531/25656_1 /TAXON_ID=36882 /ORGANISM="Pyramimonas amylifera, Strain CCMP720" /LENGTH=497 /DNA_ID=CAMNT_0041899623 /DNA_START=99 /DNA_END=1592 /DNA_ORIENTATION=-
MAKRILEDYYVVDDELGSGGFSTVRLGTSKKTKQRVAIKTLDKAGRGYSGDYALIRNEISIMAFMLEKLKDSRHIIKMSDVFDEAKSVHLVLELCEGGELFERIIEKGHFSEQDASRIIKQICMALRDLHSMHIHHRDMKPENILFVDNSDDSSIKVMDFGLSHILGTPDAMVGLFGSLDYIAPEALLNKTYYDVTDTWAVGVILYILLSGYPPFYSENTREKQMSIVQGRYDFDEPIWERVSKEAKQLIQGLLVVDHKKRLTASQVLEHPWVRDLQGASSAPFPASVATGISQFNARRKFRAAAYAAVCMARQLKNVHKHLNAFVGSKTLSQAELEKLHAQFSKVAHSGSGILYPQFEEVMESLNLQMPNLQRIFQLFDLNGDGVVDQRELVVGLSTMRDQAAVMDDERSLKFCFDVYDEDGNGSLSREEVSSMLKHLIVKNDASGVMQAEALGDLFESMDANSDGVISYEEFKLAIREKPYLVQGILDPLSASIA